MRNLKKVLAVGLALVMALSLAISAGAFTDDADIANTDAVNLLTQLGVINGFTDGSFRPDGNVTRAQMAKMIYVAIRTKDDSAVNFTNANTGLTDLAAATWAKGYVNFAFASDIVNGYPDSSFRPNSNVTGYEAAKMLLTMLGYSAATEGYTGTGWDFNVAVDAATAGLLDDLEAVDLSLPLNRDNAAQMIYNAFYAMPVTYPDGVLTKGDDTYAVAKFGLTEVTGILIANDYASLDGTAALADGDSEISGADAGTYDIDSAALLLGQSVKFFTDGDDTCYGNVLAGSDNVVVTYTGGGDVDDKADDADLTVDEDADFLINYAPSTSWDDDAEKDSAAERDAFDKIGATITLIDNNDDGDVDYVLSTEYTLSQVATYDEPDADDEDDVGSLTISAGANGSTGDLAYDGDEVVGFEDVADADYVNYVEIGGMLYVSVADEVTGEATAYSSSVVKIDGVSYTKSGLSAAADTSAELTAITTNPTISSTYTFYLDPNGYAVGYGDVIEEADVYAFLYAYSAAAENPVTEEDASGWVRLGFLDGTMGVYEVDVDTAEDLIAGLGEDTDFVNQIVSYVITDGVVTGIDLTPTGLVSDTAITIADGTITLLDTVPDPDAVIANTYLNNATAFFYVGSATANADAYIGYKNLPTTATGNVEYIMDGTKVVIIAIDDAGTTSVSGDYAYALDTSDPVVTADGVVYPFAVDGAEVELTLLDTDGNGTPDTTPVEGHVYTYETDADGVVTSLDDETIDTGTVDLVYEDDGLVVIDGDVYNYDAADVYDLTDGVAMGTLEADQNVIFVLDSDDILVIYIVD